MRPRTPPALRLAFVAPWPGRSLARVSAMAAICVAGTLGALHWNLQVELASVANELAGAHRARTLAAERAAIAPDIRIRTAEETRAANVVIRQLRLPWEDLFAAIETSIDDDVTLIAVEPQSDSGMISITAEARSVQSMANYGQRLASSARFFEVRVQDHQVQTEDPQKPVRFTVLARWLMSGDTPKGAQGGPG